MSLSIKQINRIFYYLGLDAEAVAQGERSREQYYGMCERVPEYQSSITDLGSKGVLKIVNFINTLYKQKQEPRLLTIIPLGQVANCHGNAKKAVHLLNEMGYNFTVVRGYNLISCPCNHYCSAEIHSVMKDEKTGLFYDITPDFDRDMKYKMFLECEFMTKYYQYISIELKCRELDFIHLKKSHNCPANDATYSTPKMGDGIEIGTDKGYYMDALKKIKQEPLEDWSGECRLTDLWRMLASRRNNCAIHTGDGIYRWEDINYDEPVGSLIDCYEETPEYRYTAPTRETVNENEFINVCGSTPKKGRRKKTKKRR